MINDLFVNLFSELFCVITGSIFVLFSNYIFKTLPAKKLWNIYHPKDLIICTSTSSKTDTGEYIRPATGIGQVRALAYISASLNKAYSNTKVRNILLSVDQPQDSIENDLILLGGPKNNDISRLFLDKLRNLNIVAQKMSTISWLVEGEEAKYEGIVENKEVLTDYGIIIRMKNPFCSNNKTTIALFSGSHTYGTIAASKYFTQFYKKNLIKNKFLKKNIVIIVKCDVRDGYPFGIKKIKEYAFDESD